MRNTQKIFSALLIIVLMLSLIPATAISTNDPPGDYDTILVGETKPVSGTPGSVIYTFIPEETGWLRFHTTGAKNQVSVTVLLYDSDIKVLTGATSSINGSEINEKYLFEARNTYYFQVLTNDPFSTDCAFAIKDDLVPATGVSIMQGYSGSAYEKTHFDLYAELEPENCIPEELTWTSSNENVATIDANGRVTCVAPGETTITVTTESGFTAKYDLTVKKMETLTADVAKSIEVTDGSGENYSSFTPTASGNYSINIRTNSSTAHADLYNSDMNRKESVLNSANGTKTVSLKAGKTYYLHTQDSVDNKGVVDDFKIDIVVNRVVKAKSVSITQGKYYTTYEKTSTQFKCSYEPLNAVPEGCTWISSDEGVATVSQAGNVSFNAPGKANITVKTESGLSATCQVKVLAIPELFLHEAQIDTIEEGFPSLYYAFTPEESGPYRFNVSSSDAQTYGILYDSDMDVIDDSQHGYKYGIRCRLEAGETYYVRTHQAVDGEVGAIAVSVEALKSAVSLDILSAPERTEYIKELLEEEIDLTGLSVQIKWNDGTKTVWHYDSDPHFIEDDYIDLELDKDTGKITVRYAGLTAGCQLTLTDNPVDHIEIDTAPSAEYEYGESNYVTRFEKDNADGSPIYLWINADQDQKYHYLNPEDLVFTVYYTDETSEQFSWEDIEDEKIKGHRITFEAEDPVVKKGENRFTLHYMKHSADFVVKVKGAGA
ncbi:Ig domain-containing protein [Ruminococcus sp.]|uniref:Ig-like domain-containing protein n=1 Tax=Ruminococcus sp. TaxID=41978 RepID=UPI0038907C3C